ncbi:hypothetical protein D3C72_1080500 [compost metagenome]
MQRCQHQVTGERGLNGDLRGFEIADFANHDDVRVLTQDRAQGLGKGQVDLGVDLCLADAGQFIFDRVFHRHDVALAGIELAQRGIQRGGFARARGPGHQHDAVWLGHQLFEAAQGFTLHADRAEAEFVFALVQQAQHGTLAMGTGQGGDTHIDGARAQAQADTAVLRQALFRNVEVGHDLEARDQCGVQCAVRLHHFAQGAVNAKAHARMALIGLDMDVAGSITRGLGQQGVEHADDGRITCGFQQVLHRRDVLHHARKIGAFLHFADHGGGVRFAVRVGSADALGQLGIGQLGQMLDRKLAQHLGQCGAIGHRAVPQQVLAGIFFQQQLAAARKGIGQGMAHQVNRSSIKARNACLAA